MSYLATAGRRAHARSLGYDRARMQEAVRMWLAVSVKGVLIEDGSVLLRENERGEWELPGGRPEPGEDPTACLIREFAEELGAATRSGRSSTAGTMRCCPAAM